MSEFATKELLLNVASWRQDTIDPNTAGVSGAVGSLQMQSSSYPTANALYLKHGPGNFDWVRQNLLHLNVYNVKNSAYGATGDGITDDTAAIQAAINACAAAGGGIVYFPPVNVAGGKFYKITRQGGAGGSFCLSVNNQSKILFLGDGYASKVEIVDANANALYGFQIFNGSTQIKFLNFHISGEGISVPGPGTPAPAKDLIRVAGQAADANAGTGMVSVEEMHWSATPGARVAVQGDDLTHAVTRVRYRYNLSTADCYNGFSAGPSTTNLSYVDGISCEYSWFSSSVGTWGYGLSIQDYGSLFSCLGCITRNTSSSNRSLQGVRGTTAWCIVDNGGTVSINQLNAKRPIIRGCVIISPTGDNTGGVETHAITFGRLDSNRFDGQIVGNVVVMNGNQTNSIPICPNSQPFVGIQITDNFVSVTNAINNNGAILVSSSNPEALAQGNITVQTTNGAAVGYGVDCLIVATPADAIAMVGNLCLATGANIQGVGVRYRLEGAANGGNVMLSGNLVNRTDVGVSFSRSGAQTWGGNRSVTDNNASGLGTSTVTLPSGNPGVTGEGSAGPVGEQITVVNTTPGGNVAAPTGSLCANTAGTPATTINYKESGSSTSGWFGVGECTITMGALAGSTATANRFFAPGSLGLVAESSVEIQWVMPRPCQMRHMYLLCAAGTGGGNNTYRLRKNGADIAVQLTIANTATSGSDLGNSVLYAAGDKVSLRVSKSIAPTTPQTNIILTIGVV